jgi:hypothetical protein
VARQEIGRAGDRPGGQAIGRPGAGATIDALTIDDSGMGRRDAGEPLAGGSRRGPAEAH